jgi:hypothetical protein
LPRRQGNRVKLSPDEIPWNQESPVGNHQPPVPHDSLFLRGEKALLPPSMAVGFSAWLAYASQPA